MPIYTIDIRGDTQKKKCRITKPSVKALEITQLPL